MKKKGLWKACRWYVGDGGAVKKEQFSPLFLSSTCAWHLILEPAGDDCGQLPWVNEFSCVNVCWKAVYAIFEYHSFGIGFLRTFRAKQKLWTVFPIKGTHCNSHSTALCPAQTSTLIAHTPLLNHKVSK